jgi:PAS domain S-box-containing protein
LSIGNAWKILVVEDDPGVAKLQRRELERRGFAVVSASSADEALAFLAKESVDLAVLDYNLAGGCSGLDLHSRMRNLGYQVPVIMVTGFSDERTVIRALREGVRDFVPKSPEYLEYLPEAVQRTLDSLRLERKLAESEARLGTVIASAKDAILYLDDDKRIGLFNPAAERMFKCSEAEALGRYFEDFIPNEIKFEPATSFDRPPTLSATVRQGRWGVRSNGERFPIEASTAKATIMGRRWYTVVVRDVTERRRVESNLKTQHAVACIMAQSRTVDEAVPSILQAVGDNFGWRGGRLWTAEKSLGSLHLMGGWGCQPTDVPRNGKDEKRSSLALGAGMAGTVWKNRTPMFVSQETNAAAEFKEGLSASNLKSACGFPVFSSGDVVGVMEFFSSELRGSDPALEELMEAVGGLVGQFIERKRAECEIVRSAGDLAEAQRIAQLGSWRWIVAPDVLEWSDAVGRILGVGREDCRKALSIFLKSFSIEKPAATSGVESAIPPLEFDRHIRRPDGVKRTLHVKAHCVFNDDGSLKEMFGTAQDVTDRIAAQERIREQAALLDQARDAIIVEGMDGNIQYWNRGAERVFGWTSQEALGKSAATLLAGGSDLDWESPHRSVAASGEWQGELRQHTKYGKELILESRWTRLDDEIGRPKATLLIQTDISERKRLEAKFHRAQRLESVGTLAGGMAHDLNNILTPIRMSLEMLRLNLTSAQRAEMLDSLQEAAKRGSDMVRRILSFVRGEEGQRVQFDLATVIDELLALLRQTLPKIFQLRSRIPRKLPNLHGDPTQIHQLLMNLFLNARDAMPNGGSIGIEVEVVSLNPSEARNLGAERPGTYVRMSVEDDGVGMPPEVLERVFEPFFTTKAVGVGTGLGLSTALGIAKGHDGFMCVDSRRGVGTRFDVYLPALPSAIQSLRITGASSNPTLRQEPLNAST